MLEVGNGVSCVVVGILVVEKVVGILVVVNGVGRGVGT
jgi:hypothetical protein